MKSPQVLTALLGALLWHSVCSDIQAGSLEEAVDHVAKRYPEVRHVEADILCTTPTGHILLLDTRDTREYSVSHLEGALRFVDRPATLQWIRQRQPRLIVVYCSVGERSSRIARDQLQAFTDIPVVNLKGGIFNWAIAGRGLVDAKGMPTDKVHPYDSDWGKLLPPELRSELPRD